jgi:hypothetical protein
MILDSGNDKTGDNLNVDDQKWIFLFSGKSPKSIDDSWFYSEESNIWGSYNERSYVFFVMNVI